MNTYIIGLIVMAISLVVGLIIHATSDVDAEVSNHERIIHTQVSTRDSNDCEEESDDDDEDDEDDEDEEY